MTGRGGWLGVETGAIGMAGGMAGATWRAEEMTKAKEMTEMTGVRFGRSGQ